MWIYKQSTGEMFHDDEKVATGYAGRGLGKNNAEMQTAKNLGPVPRGFYTIGSPYDTKTHGPHVLRLTPDAENKMFDRAGFLIHGDSISQPGTASFGCIILPRAIREKISKSGDNRLEVVA